MSWFVCGVGTASTDEHHIVPQNAGGTDGPTVSLCANCHNAIHVAARRMRSGKSGEEFLAHLDDESRQRAATLVKCIIIAENNRSEDSHRPMLTVVLHDAAYLRALDLLVRDRGFGSREKAVNGILREIARGYGLL